MKYNIYCKQINVLYGYSENQDHASLTNYEWSKNNIMKKTRSICRSMLYKFFETVLGSMQSMTPKTPQLSRPESPASSVKNEILL